MKFIKHPLKEEQKGLPTVIFHDGKVVAHFKPEMIVDGMTGEYRKILALETDDPKIIKLLEQFEKEESSRLTSKKKRQLEKRMRRFSQENIKAEHRITQAKIDRINAQCLYDREEVKHEKAADKHEK